MGIYIWAFDRQRKQVPKPLFTSSPSGLGHKAPPPQGGSSPNAPGRGQGRDLLPEACVQVITRGRRGPRPRRRVLSSPQAPILIFLGRASRNEVPETHLQLAGAPGPPRRQHHSENLQRAEAVRHHLEPAAEQPFPARSTLVLRARG